eukprot:1092720-Pyramimonas_sp.AAC.1
MKQTGILRAAGPELFAVPGLPETLQRPPGLPNNGSGMRSPSRGKPRDLCSRPVSYGLTVRMKGPWKTVSTSRGRGAASKSGQAWAEENGCKGTLAKVAHP